MCFALFLSRAITVRGRSPNNHEQEYDVVGHSTAVVSVACGGGPAGRTKATNAVVLTLRSSNWSLASEASPGFLLVAVR